MSGYFRRLITQAAITTTQLRPVTVHPYAVSTRLSAAAPLEDAADACDAAAVPVRQPEEPSALDLQSSGRAVHDRLPTRPARPRVDPDKRGSEASPWLVRDERSASVAMNREPSSTSRTEPVTGPEPLKREQATRDHPAAAAGKIQRLPELTMPSARTRADSDFRLLPDADVSIAHPALAGPLLHAGAHRAVTGSRGIRATTRPDHSGSDGAPEVHVTIGRIEVTAQHAPPPTRKRRHQPAGMSLDEYLSRRRQGGS